MAVTDAQIDAIDGWFLPLDRALFRHLLDESATRLGGGDLAELGVYLGKSAVLMGDHLADGDVFTVVDLFDPEADGSHEHGSDYSGLTRQAFERHYRALHGRLPVVVQGQSQTVTEHARHGRHRFVHVDASHLYEHVQGDIAAARTLLADDGIVVFDDIRSEHTPGVPAAVYGSVATSSLRPFAVSQAKFYGTWGDASAWFGSTREWAERHHLDHEVQHLAGAPVVVFAQPVAERADARWVPFVPPVLLPGARRLREAVEPVVRRLRSRG